MSLAPTLWEEGHERGRHVVALGAAVALSLAVVDLVRIDRLGAVYDVGFVCLCVLLALLVRAEDFFVVGVLPPLLMLGVCLLLGAVSPAAVADPTDGLVQAVVTGLAAHSVPLGVGYLLCLAVLAVRQHVIRTRSARRRRLPGAAPRGLPPTSR